MVKQRKLKHFSKIVRERFDGWICIRSQAPNFRNLVYLFKKSEKFECAFLLKNFGACIFQSKFFSSLSEINKILKIIIQFNLTRDKIINALLLISMEINYQKKKILKKKIIIAVIIVVQSRQRGSF